MQFGKFHGVALAVLGLILLGVQAMLSGVAIFAAGRCADEAEAKQRSSSGQV